MVTKKGPRAGAITGSKAIQAAGVPKLKPVGRKQLTSGAPGTITGVPVGRKRKPLL